MYLFLKLYVSDFDLYIKISFWENKPVFILNQTDQVWKIHTNRNFIVIFITRALYHVHL